MGDQVYFEDVSEGMELPAEVREPTTAPTGAICWRFGDFYEIHYDKDFAESTGLNGVILHGALKNAMLGSFITNWAGPGRGFTPTDLPVSRHGLPGRTDYGERARESGVPGRQSKPG